MMATWPFSRQAIPALTVSVCLLAVLASCSDDVASTSGSAISTAIVDADSAEDWLEIARVDLSKPRQSFYTSSSARSGSQRGRLVFQDRTHFLIRSIIPVATTSSDGEAEDTEFEVVRAADGKELRILLPAVLGTESSVAVFPVSRFDELANLRPGHPLHRFRLEALNPVLMAQALLEVCTDVEEPDDSKQATTKQADSAKDSTRERLIASLRAEDLLHLGVIDLNDREPAFQIQIEIATGTGKFVGLKVLGTSSNAVRLQLQFEDLPEDSHLHEEGFTLTIPAGHDIVDLSQQLNTSSLPR
jgi:outer membrane lipoprotein-sorting protein